MRITRITLPLAVVAVAFLATAAHAEGPAKGTPDWKSAGPIAFGPRGLLILGDTQGAALFAVETGDVKPDSAGGELKVDAINEKIAAVLGTTADQIMINDLAVNPASGKAYLSVARGKGPTAAPVLVRVDHAGKVEVVSLDDVAFAKTALPNPPSAAQGPRSARVEAITDLAYIDGRVFVAGLSNEEFSSRLLAIPYPFTGSAGDDASIEIYHGAHGRLETKSPVRTFVGFEIAGEPYLLAAYTCTPLVKLPVAALKPGAHVKGETIAELGNRNKPLDMIVYQKDGKSFLLLANSSRGVMKISTEGVDHAKSINAPVRDGKHEGQPYETIASLQGVTQLDKMDKDHAVILLQNAQGQVNLETIALP